MFKWLDVLILALLTLSLSGCVSFPAIGVFEHNNEVLYGTVSADLFEGKSNFVLTGKVTGLECVGSSELTQFSGNPCDDQRGQIFGNCNDGRSILGKWVGTSCTAGYGFGKDNHGNSFTFTFGMKEEKAQALLQTHLKFAAKKPALPTYSPENKAVKAPAHRLGTAFYISRQGHLLTTYSLIQNAKKIRIRDFFGQTYKIRIIVTDPVNDLAIIKAEVQSEPLPINYDAATSLGSELVAIGYHSLLSGPKVTSGQVNSLRGISNDIRFFQIDAPTHSANTGAPLIDKDGKVVGVITTHPSPQKHTTSETQAVKGTYVLPLINLADIQSDEGLELPPQTHEEPINKFQRSIVLIIAQ